MTHLLTTLSVSHAIQGIIVGAVLAFLTANLIMNAVVCRERQ
jgi:mannose/fructose/N-acetylgalactosamine-specific phosphotransferase system component IID